MKLITKNNQQLVIKTEKIRKTLEFAIKKIGEGRFLKIVQINKDELKEQKIPTHVVEASCRINEQDWKIPVIYQNIWFCLDNVEIERRRKDSKTEKYKVHFKPIFVSKTPRIADLLEETLKIVSRKELGKLVGRSRDAVDLWVKKSYKLPIITVMKCCQILGKNIWNEIDNHKIFSKTYNRSILFRNETTPEMLDIIVWIVCEGYLNSTNSHVCIYQNKDGFVCLNDLKEKFIKLFDIDPNRVRLIEYRPGNLVLDLSCEPIRQILCLRYGIPLGYKSFSVDLDLDKLKKEEKKRILAKLFETEGSFSHHTKNHGFMQPFISFYTYSKNLFMTTQTLLKELKFNFSTNDREREGRIEYIINLSGLGDVAKFSFEILPYIVHPTKVKALLSLLNQREYILRLRMKNNLRFRSLVFTVKNNGYLPKLQKESQKFGVEIQKYNIYDWLRNDKRRINPTFIQTLLVCKVLNMDYFTTIPKYFSFLLYIQKFISFNRLCEFRGITYDNVF